MPIREILTYPEPFLKRVVSETDPRSPRLAGLFTDLVDTLRSHHGGVGLSAPQLGESFRAIVVDMGSSPREGSHHGLLCLVNPRIVEASDDTEVLDEGCLSLPGVNVPVERPTLVRVRARDLRGRRLEYDAEDLEARVIQHEIDHLDGVLILERTSREERGRVLRELRERQTAAVPSGSGL